MFWGELVVAFFGGCGFVFQSGAHVLAICYMLELKSVICWFLDSFIALIQHYHLISFCFFMSHWCFTPCQHDSCSILPRNHKSQKNKKPNTTNGEKKNEKKTNATKALLFDTLWSFLGTQIMTPVSPSISTSNLPLQNIWRFTLVLIG